MRKTPLDDNASHAVRLLTRTSRDAGILADLLNGAAKPQGYPQTDTGRTNSQPKPRRIVKAHALAIAISHVLDQLDTGDVTAQDLLKRATLLAEINPAKARAKRAAHDEVVERNRLNQGVDEP